MNFPFFKKNNGVRNKSVIISFKDSYKKFYEEKDKIVAFFKRKNETISLPLFWMGIIGLPFFLMGKPLFFFCFFILASLVSEKMFNSAQANELKSNNEQFMFYVNEFFDKEENQYNFLYELSLYKQYISETKYNIIKEKMTSYFLNPANYSIEQFKEVYDILNAMDNDVLISEQKNQFDTKYKAFLENNNLAIDERNEMNGDSAKDYKNVVNLKKHL